MTPKFFRTARAFERWLAANHRKARAVLIGFHKVGSGKPSITYPEALDTALVYGWIDGVRERLDDEAYTIRFTPRTKKSLWSAVNIRRAKKLIQERRMKPAGFAAFRMRDEQGHAGFHTSGGTRYRRGRAARAESRPEGVRLFSGAAAEHETAVRVLDRERKT